MAEQNLTQSGIDWRAKITAVQAELDLLLPKLVEAEAELAERLAAISAFEFKLRARVSRLTRKLDDLEEEIAALRRRLRWLEGDWPDEMESEAAAWAAGESAAEGDYRYREPVQAKEAQQELNKDEKAELKQLYRQLARRFHPDLALNEADRAYRTELMMAINTAYAVADLAQLQQLAQEPDSVSDVDYARQDEKLFILLQRELTRVLRRMKEIEQELATLEKHQSAKYMRQAERAASTGRNWFAEMEQQLRESVVNRRMERDILVQKLADMEDDVGLTAVSGDEFADIVWDVSLDDAFVEDLSPAYDRYIRQRMDRVYFEENFDDDVDFD